MCGNLADEVAVWAGFVGVTCVYEMAWTAEARGKGKAKREKNKDRGSRVVPICRLVARESISFAD